MQSIPRRIKPQGKRLRTLAPQIDGEVVAVYARSAADDVNGTACQDQVRRALELIEHPAHTVVYADAGTSGLDANRPALRRLLDDARRGILRRVVVCDLVRLARSVTLLETITGELRAAGVDVVNISKGQGDA
jgi:site-specific DNA recombinase